MPLPHARLKHARAAHASASKYVLAWLALLALAMASYLLSLAHLGSLDIVLALTIALVKTAIVVAYFMELVEHRFVNALVLVVSGAFAVLLLSLMVADVTTRHTFPAGPLPVSTTRTPNASRLAR